MRHETEVGLLTQGLLAHSLMAGSAESKEGQSVAVDVQPSRLEQLRGLQKSLNNLKQQAVGDYAATIKSIYNDRAWENAWSPLLKGVVGLIGLTVASTLTATLGLDYSTSATTGIAMGYIFGIGGCAGCCCHGDASHMARNHAIDDRERRADNMKVEQSHASDLVKINAALSAVSFSRLPESFAGMTSMEVSELLYETVRDCDNAIAEEEQRLAQPSASAVVAVGRA